MSLRLLRTNPRPRRNPALQWQEVRRERALFGDGPKKLVIEPTAVPLSNPPAFVASRADQGPDRRWYGSTDVYVTDHGNGVEMQEVDRVLRSLGLSRTVHTGFLTDVIRERLGGYPHPLVWYSSSPTVYTSEADAKSLAENAFTALSKG
jgi:hypothetical protein